MEININVKIDTKRLQLQPVSEEYKVDICNGFTAEVTKFMPFNPTGNIQMTEEYIENSLLELTNGTNIHFCILDKETREFLGCCGIHNIHTKGIEIGLWIKKNAQSKGYGTETVIALINFVEENFDCDYLVHPVDKDNLASRKIPEKLGFLPSGFYSRKKNETEILNVVEYRKNQPHHLQNS